MARSVKRHLRHLIEALGLVALGFAVAGALAWAQTPPPGTPTPCDTQLQIVDASRRYVEAATAQEIASLKAQLAAAQAKLTEAKPTAPSAAKPGAPPGPAAPDGKR